MNLDTSREDEVLTVNLKGRIDGNNHHVFEASLQQEITDADKVVLLDCEDLSYINSAGLRAILKAAKVLWERDGKLALCALSPLVEDVITIAGFHKIIPIHDSRDDLLASLDS